ncbi:ABC transporter ATP-binding protein [Oerskovia sp. KBS0722]|uniref:ABC transporter ATP-binding protein n=1 Tax=Oerskovia sp. KBS0722 TaxID=1179673 RepID=UPI00143D94BE|nr:ATP-binding cassette domain-containing protein [Oerskovia sp. KBS0722]
MELLGVSREFDNGRVRPIDDVSYQIDSASTSAIVGASGEGKTTLLNLIGLLDRPTRGEILIRGRPTTRLGSRELTRARAEDIGFVFQDALLDLRRTAVENVELALAFIGVHRARRRQMALESLGRTNMLHRADVQCIHLSGGEKQRVAISRAISHSPGLLLCDEPTGALDRRNSDHVTELLTGLSASGTAVLIVTHDRRVATACEVIYEVSRGKVVRDC